MQAEQAPGRPRRPWPVLALAALVALLVVVGVSVDPTATAAPIAGDIPSHPALLAIFGVSALLVVALVYLRQPPANQVSRGRVHPPLRLLVVLLLVLVLGFVGLLAIVSTVPASNPPSPTLVRATVTPAPIPFASPTALPPPAPTPGPTPTLHFSRGLWLAPALVLALLTLLLAAINLRTGQRQFGAPASVMIPETPLQEALDEGIEALLAEPDPRRAVIAAYAGMERVLARHGLARRPHEAPFEYLRRVLPAARTDARAVHQLTALYEQAHFSDHPITPAMRETAIQALQTIRANLAQPPAEASAS
jgi:hypothetical protein